MNIVIKNRPTKAGIYWQQIPLNRYSTVPELESRLKDVTLLQGVDVVCGFPALPDGRGGYQTLTGESAKKAYEERTEGLVMLPKIAVLGDVQTKVASMIGFYLVLKKDLADVPGLQGKPVETIVTDKGQCTDKDAYGNAYTYQIDYSQGTLTSGVSGYGALPQARMYQPAPGEVIPLDLGQQGGLGVFPAVVVGFAQILGAVLSILGSVLTVLFYLGLIYVAYTVYTTLIQPGYEYAKKLLPTGFFNTVPGSSGGGGSRSSWTPLLITGGVLVGLYWWLRPRRL